MAEELFIDSSLSKKEKYTSLIPMIKGLVEAETSLIANLANTAAVLKEAFHWWWVGFYLVEENQLVLGPFQGPVACTRIAFGKGVCGTAWKEKTTQLVPDVDQFPGHIACSSASRSELVLPLINEEGEVWGVLDIDSEHLNHFDEVDVNCMEEIVGLLHK